MAYQLKTDGSRVMLYVLAGADKSLAGLSIRNSTIITMTFNELYSIITQTLGIQERNHFIISLFEHYIHQRDDEEIVVLESIEQGDKREWFELDFIEMLKLYHSGDIYCCYYTSYKYKAGRIISGGKIINVTYAHAIGTIPCPYSLTDSEKTGFPQWFAYFYPQTRTKICNDSFKSMLKMYDRSYLIGITESEYIMLFSILEMIFGSGHSEITYQISRGTALLLSQSSDEMNTIYKQMKKLYTVRSKYVHNGTKVPLERLYELREMVRKVLIRLVVIGYHAKDKSFDELRDEILLAGYHNFANKKWENAAT